MYFKQEFGKDIEKELKEKAMNERLNKEKIDITMPSKKTSLGSVHPITQIINDVKEIFIGMGSGSFYLFSVHGNKIYYLYLSLALSC